MGLTAHPVYTGFQWPWIRGLASKMGRHVGLGPRSLVYTGSSHTGFGWLTLSTPCPGPWRTPWIPPAPSSPRPRVLDLCWCRAVPRPRALDLPRHPPVPQPPLVPPLLPSPCGAGCQAPRASLPCPAPSQLTHLWMSSWYWSSLLDRACRVLGFSHWMRQWDALHWTLILSGGLYCSATRPPAAPLMRNASPGPQRGDPFLLSQHEGELPSSPGGGSRFRSCNNACISQGLLAVTRS